MVNAVLFFRTDATLTNNVSALLSGTTAQKAQCLEYDAPDNILEAIQENYGNRINEQVSVNSDGVRQLFIRDDGLRARSFTLQGMIKKASTDITKLKTFRTMKQTTDTLIHGCFGFRIGNADFFQVDPTADRGLMIKDMKLGYDGNRIVRYDLQVTLAFGGTHIVSESGNIGT